MGSKHKADISEYYRKKNIFLTGVTGFIGKAVIEKLIRSCPDIGNIYCLIRPKKFQDPTERLAKICSSEVSYFCQWYLQILLLSQFTNHFSL